MDDPWGSPWATDDTQPKLDLPAPPPLAHTPQTPGRSPSPWGAGSDHDDAWGGWNAGSGGAESPGWSRSPGLRPARSGTVSRQPSPDAWARLTPLNTARNSAEVRKTRQSFDSGVGDSGISLGEHTTLDLVAQPNHERKSSEIETLRSDALGKVNGASRPTKNLPAQDEEEYSSQHSQSPVGSPTRAITTVGRPEPTRQASKVQELVEMYDGIAQLKDAPAEPLVAGPRIALTGPNDDVGDYIGDSHQEHEKPEQDVLSPKLSAGKEVSANGALESVAAVASDEQEGHDDGLQDSDNDLRASGDPERSSDRDNLPSSPRQSMIEGIANAQQRPNVPSVAYSPDLSQLDALFPSIPPSTVEPELVPDVIIDDTFASIAERKAWYRISRHGPMRQHNSGNDEDYVRLDWRRAEVRHQTLLIVRRWMEEDSIAGRVVLGRRTGPGGASMFNWDSEAPQVQIAELLGKKSSHSRGTSITSKQSLTSPISPLLSGPIATFGWSSSPPAPETAPTPAKNVAKPEGSIPSPGLTTKSHAPAIAPPPSIDAVVAKSGAGMAPAAVSSNSADARNAHDDDDGFDDDWGEMVSSPTLPSHPTMETSMISSAESDFQAMHLNRQSLIDPPRSSLSAAGELWGGTSEESKEPRVYEAPKVAKEHTTSIQMAQTQSKITKPVPDTARGQPHLHSDTITHSHQTTTEDTEAVIREIIHGLPDLSYMLR